MRSFRREQQCKFFILSESELAEGLKVILIYLLKGATSDIIGFIKLKNNKPTTQFIRSQLPNDIYPVQFEDGMVRGAFTKKSLRHYVNVAACDERVYALYCGLSEEECVPGPMRGRFVRCYEWSGNWLNTLDLGMDVQQISVSPDNDCLYALESSEDGFRVLKYEL